MDLEGLDSFTLARIAQIEAKRRAAMPPMRPPPAPTPDGLQDADQAPSIPGGVGSRLERRPERGLAGRLGPAFRGRCPRLVREFRGTCENARFDKVGAV
jgi:hypothetical protein